MDTSTLEAALYQATISTFEELALLFPERELGTAHQHAQPMRAVSISFAGAFAGTLLLRMSDVALATAAANMIGADLPPDDSTCRDALGEIANVICGNLLPAIAGESAVFRLSAPAAADVTGGAFSVMPLAAAAHVGLDEGRADVLLFLSPVAG